VGYEGSRNVSHFSAKTIAQKKRDFLDSGESDQDSLRRSARPKARQKEFDMEISCREVRQELANYMEDDITVDLRLRIERHFLRCDGCSALYDGLRQIIYLVNESDLIELPVGLSQRLFQRLNMKRANPAC
jgi:hypothetical protein